MATQLHAGDRECDDRADQCSALAAARAALGLPSITYTRPTITSGMTIFKVDLEELRNGVK